MFDEQIWVTVPKETFLMQPLKGRKSWILQHMGPAWCCTCRRLAVVELLLRTLGGLAASSCGRTPVITSAAPHACITPPRCIC